jgi:hypothetical protein
VPCKDLAPTSTSAPINVPLRQMGDHRPGHLFVLGPPKSLSQPTTSKFPSSTPSNPLVPNSRISDADLIDVDDNGTTLKEAPALPNALPARVQLGNERVKSLLRQQRPQHAAKVVSHCELPLPSAPARKAKMDVESGLVAPPPTPLVRPTHHRIIHSKNASSNLTRLGENDIFTSDRK